MIAADIEKKTIVVTYRGKSASGHFDDDVLRQMTRLSQDTTGFQDATLNVLSAIGKLISQVV